MSYCHIHISTDGKCHYCIEFELWTVNIRQQLICSEQINVRTSNMVPISALASTNMDNSKEKPRDTWASSAYILCRLPV